MVAPTALTHDLSLALDPARLMQACGLPPDPWQREVLRSQAPRHLLLCCRQSGKSSTCAALALHHAVYEPGGLVLLVSPSLRQSAELFAKVRTFYQQLAAPPPLKAESVLRYELGNGSRIVALPGTEGNIRGYSAVTLLILDEAARVTDELYYSVRPMLATSGGTLVCLSTPFGTRGWFYQAWMHGEDWTRTKITAGQCARISAAFLQEEQRVMPQAWYEQEYFCIFHEAVASVFKQSDIEAMFAADAEPVFGEGFRLWPRATFLA
jgi:hypothetical protein